MIRDEEREREREGVKKKSPLEGGRGHDKRGVKGSVKGGRVTIVKRL